MPETLRYNYTKPTTDKVSEFWTIFFCIFVDQFSVTDSYLISTCVLCNVLLTVVGLFVLLFFILVMVVWFSSTFNCCCPFVFSHSLYRKQSQEIKPMSIMSSSMWYWQLYSEEYFIKHRLRKCRRQLCNDRLFERQL